MLSAYDRAALFFGLERLELRRMLSISASVSSSHVLNITGTSGNDTITINQLSNGKVSVSGVSTQFSPGSTSGKFNQIFVNAGNGNDIVTISNNVTYTSSTLSGSGGNDSLTGGKGNDSLEGDNDNDTLDGGGGGADIFNGGEGMDIANYSYRTDNLNISLDNIANDGAKGEDDNVESSVEEVIAGSGNDTLTGSPNDDFLSGGAGNDLIHGEDGNDVITGGPGDNQLFGDAGDDFIQAKNSQVDSLLGGSNPDGSPALDLASVDSIDVPAVQSQQQAHALAFLQALQGKPQAEAVSSPSSLDTTYGDGGNGIQVGPTEFWDSVDATAVDSQGRVIFVGSKSLDGDGEEMVAARFNADGTIDNNFGNNGEADISFATGSGYNSETDDFARGVAIGPNDSIFVVGSTILDSDFQAGTGGSVLAIAKLDNTGNLDTNFNGTGEQTLDLTSDESDPFSSEGQAVTVQADGNIVVAADRSRENTDVIYDPAGDFDPSNNPSGVWTYGFSNNLGDPLTTYDTATQVDGIDYWTSSSRKSASTLAPDVLHNDTGDDVDGIQDGELALDPGFYGEYSQVEFTAPVGGFYNISGEFDPGVDEGTPTTDVHVLVNGSSVYDGTLDDENNSAPFEDDNEYLNPGDTVSFAVGYGSDQDFSGDTTSLSAQVERTSASDDQTLAVARFTPNGQPDPNFYYGQGWDSIVVGSSVSASSIALQTFASDGGTQRILIGGTGDGNFVVARFNADGTVDGNFGDAGYGYSSDAIEGDGGNLNGLAVDANNNIYAVGSIETELDDAIPLDGLVKTNEVPLHGEEAALVSYDSSGNFQNDIEEGANADQGATYNSVTVDSKGHILAAGQEDGNYLIGRYNSDLSFDTSFASQPLELSLGDPSDESDTALNISVLDDNKIIASGFSNVDGDLELSAVRLDGDQPPSNPFEVEEFIDPSDFNNPPPELQMHLDGLTPAGLLIVESQPQDDGSVIIHTNDTHPDVVTITVVTAPDGSKDLAVTINGITDYYAVATTPSLTIHTGSGADSIIASSSVTTKLIIYGGEGNDTIQGGGGTNLLFGEGGNDKLTGGAKADVLNGGAGSDSINGSDGNDILIGGPNNDTLNGGNGDDILIGASTAYDTNVGALQSLLAEWSSSASHTARVNNIRNGTGPNAPYYLRGTGANKTVIDDSAVDVQTGGSGVDWFFRKTTGSFKDIDTDSLATETFDSV